MSDFTIDFTFDPQGMAELLSPTGDVGRSVANAARVTAERAKGLAPVRTGRLRASIESTPTVSSGDECSASVVARTSYARPVHRKHDPYLTDALLMLGPSDFTPNG